MARRTYNTIKLIAVCLAIYCSAFALSARDYSLILSGGYTGSYHNADDKTNGAIAELAFQMPVCNQIYFSPAAAFDMRYMQMGQWLGEFSLRAIGGYTFPVSKAAFNFFTGPRMDVKAFEYTSEVWYGDLPGYDSSDPYYNRVNRLLDVRHRF